MKDFQIFRYIKKWRYLILAISFVGSLLFYKYASKDQTYTAKIKIEYSNAEAAEGKTPSKDDIDIMEIYSSNVIKDAIEDLKISDSVDYIRSRCKVTEIIPEDVQTQKDALLEKGEEFTYFPTQYIVSFTVGADKSAAYARDILDAVIQNYLSSYSEKYINVMVAPNNAENASSGHTTYDYLEKVELIEESVLDIRRYLEQKNRISSDFRAAETGYSFFDLFQEYSLIKNSEIAGLYADILEEKLSSDKEVLKKKYDAKITSYNLDRQNYEEKLKALQEVINSYSEKAKSWENWDFKGKDGDSSYSSILQDVYNDIQDVSRNVETTYDGLMDVYVSYEDALTEVEGKIDHCQYILDTIINSQENWWEESVEENESVQIKIDKLVERTSELYEIFYATIQEYNEYLAASNITILTSISTTEGLNLKLYIVLAAVMFFMGGCVGAILLGRIGDIIEYVLYIDPKTKLPNRARCDIFIKEAGRKMLSEDYTVTVILVTNLYELNRLYGYEGGDRLLAILGKGLKNLSSEYGFFAYNGSNQFLGMMPNCPSDRVEHFMKALSMQIEQNNTQNSEYPLRCTVSYANSTQDNEYDVRNLLKLAFKNKKVDIGERTE